MFCVFPWLYFAVVLGIMAWHLLFFHSDGDGISFQHDCTMKGADEESNILEKRSHTSYQVDARS